MGDKEVEHERPVRHLVLEGRRAGEVLGRHHPAHLDHALGIGLDLIDGGVELLARAEVPEHGAQERLALERRAARGGGEPLAQFAPARSGDRVGGARSLAHHLAVCLSQPLAVEPLRLGEDAALGAGPEEAHVPAQLVAQLPGYRTIAYDRRSFMDSEGEPLADLTRHTDDAAELLAGLEAGPAIVVGWSIGGVIALELAVRRPACVAALVLLEPPFRAKRHPTLAMLRAILVAKVRRPEAGAERFLRWALWRRDGASDLDRIGPDYRDRVRRCARAIVRELDGGTGEHIDREALAQLDVPTVLVRGTESTPEFAAACKRVRDLVPGAELVEAPGSGHAVAVDAPDVVSAAVGRTLAAAGGVSARLG